MPSAAVRSDALTRVERIQRSALTALTALALFAAALSAQAIGPANGARQTSNTRSTHAQPVPSAVAAERKTPVAVDGKLDDAAWQSATPITEFTQSDPDEGQPVSERTEVRFMFDSDALYIGARMFDKMGRAGIKTNLVRRDDNFNSDFFEVVIDGYHDHLSRAFFDVNPSGSKNDYIGIGNSCCDNGWDPVWEVKTSIDDEGWTAEIRIPLSQLRFPNADEQTWGLQVRRFIHRRQEYASWSFWRKNEPGGPNRFGHLEGLRIGNSGAKQVELLPYVVGKGAFEQHAAGDPFNKGNVNGARFGLDAKYNLTSNLTLNATINPDFGQVEVDPAVVNLSAFETFFQEKRPFFVEGSGIFGFGGINCYFCSNVSSLQAFYSRRVGRSPQGSDLATSAGPFSDVPDAATILGAGKITGRTANGYTIGILEAVTGEVNAKVRMANGNDEERLVEPLSNYFVGRLKKDYMNGNLVVGGILTSMARKKEDVFANRLADHAELYGGDWNYRWAGRRYSFTGQFAMSNVSGSAPLIASKQRASARYFNRPDRGERANGLFTDKYDTTLTSLRGGGGYMRVAKESGDWLWEAMTNVRTSGFETNDYSFLTTADYIFTNANIVRNVTKPGSWYRSMWTSFGVQTQRNFDGDVTDVQVPLYYQFQTKNFWFFNSFYIWKPELADDRMLRGGPVVRKPGTGFLNLNINTDSRQKVVGNLGFNYSTNARGGWGSGLFVGAEVRPRGNMLISFNPSWNNSRSLLQYVRAVNDPTATDFYGRRYVLSALKQKSLGLDTRVNWTFSPTMTLQLYAQPFISSGEYSEFKEFNAPRSNQWSVYGKDKGTITKSGSGSSLVYTVDPDAAGPAAPFSIANPDFNFRSLRGNAVFRWEYMPGSTLYFAWTHARSGSEAIGDFDFSRDREALFAARPDNVFLVKATWWVNR
jgi:hypothetical protein